MRARTTRRFPASVGCRNGSSGISRSLFPARTCWRLRPQLIDRPSISWKATVYWKSDCRSDGSTRCKPPLAHGARSRPLHEPVRLERAGVRLTAALRAETPGPGTQGKRSKPNTTCKKSTSATAKQLCAASTRWNAWRGNVKRQEARIFHTAGKPHGRGHCRRRDAGRSARDFHLR